MKIVIIIKKEINYFSQIEKYTKNFFRKIYIYDSGSKKINLNKISQIKPDTLISFISNIILPDQILKHTKLYKINFHPGPPEYLGFGCYN